MILKEAARKDVSNKITNPFSKKFEVKILADASIFYPTSLA
jgi:hypothetical protein